MRFPLCFLALSSVALAKPLFHDADLEFEMQTMRQQLNDLERAQREQERRQRQQARTEGGWDWSPAWPQTSHPARTPQPTLPEAPRLAAPAWVTLCQLPSGLTINQRADYAPPPASSEQFARRWDASWQRVYAKYPSLAEASSPRAKELNAYIERTAADPALKPLFTVPEWPEVIVREFGIAHGILGRTTPLPSFLARR